MSTTTKPRKARLLKRIDLHLDNQLYLACDQKNVDYDQISFRFLSKLREEFVYVMGDFEVVSIKLSDEMSNGNDEVRIGRRCPIWMQEVELSYENIDRTGQSYDELHDYIIDLIVTGCVHVAAQYSASSEPLLQVATALKVDREETKIQFKSRFAETKDYLLEPYFKIKGLGSNSAQLFLKVTEKRTNRTGECFYMEGSASDIYGVTQKLQVKDGVISSKPTKSLYANSTMYLSRGYGLPQKSISKIEFK